MIDRMLGAVLVLWLTAAIGTAARQREDDGILEKEASAVLSRVSIPFETLAPVVDRLRAGSDQAPDRDQRGRLALLWMRGVRALLARIPFGDADEPPYRDWIARHEQIVTYSEPAGQWLITPEVMWRTHDAHRTTASAEAIAWLAIENGYPGECEGYVPCYANIMNWLDGEYLRRHPRGAHASEIVGRVREALARSLESLSGPYAASALDPSNDCGDLKAGLVPLRGAMLASNAKSRGEAVALADKLLARCR